MEALCSGHTEQDLYSFNTINYSRCHQVKPSLIDAWELGFVVRP